MSIRKPGHTASSCIDAPDDETGLDAIFTWCRDSVIAKHIKVVVTSNGI